MRTKVIVAWLTGAFFLHGPAMAQSTNTVSEDETAEEAMEGEYWDHVECKSYNRAASRLRARDDRLCLTRREWRLRELETQDALNMGERGANVEPPEGSLSRGF